MKKSKILGAVITTALAMTGMCAEISQNVISHSNSSEAVKNVIEQQNKKEGCKYEEN